MHKLGVDTAALSAEYNIEIGRWKQYGDLGKLPFDAMWCVVPPGSSSARDSHPEVELSVVVGGEAEYEGTSERISAAAGTAILLNSNEPHIIHNRSPEQPLQILSIYWMPESGITPGDGGATTDA